MQTLGRVRMGLIGQNRGISLPRSKSRFELPRSERKSPCHVGRLHIDRDAVVAITRCRDGLPGLPLRVASLDDIIASKKAAGRDRDKAVLPVLEKTLKSMRKR